MSSRTDTYFVIRSMEVIQRNEMGLLRIMSDKQDKQIALLEQIVRLLERREDDGK